jgi:hypothetical protein
MDHGALLSELYGHIIAVPAFAQITGASLGQHTPDPTLITLTPPACWVSFVGDNQIEDTNNISPTPETILFMFVAFIYLPMGAQSAMFMNAAHLPLLGKIIPGVRGKESAITGHKWQYKGQKLALVNPNRMVYAQRYNVIGVM